MKKVTKTDCKQFIQRWKELFQAQKDLDYKKSVFARDLRARFEAGEPGDTSFLNWCQDKLELHPRSAAEMLTRAFTASIAVDDKTYKAIGGYREVRNLLDKPKREQVKIIQTAVDEHRGVNAVMRNITSTLPFKQHFSTATDVRVLADYISRNGKNVPADVRVVVERYVKHTPHQWTPKGAPKVSAQRAMA